MVLVPMAQLSVYLFSQKDPKFTADYMRGLYDKLKGIAEDNIKNNEKEGKAYEEKWGRVDEEFRVIGDQIWGCEFHVAEWKPKFEKDKYNMAQNEEIVKLLKKKCGEENELYVKVNAIYEPWRDSMDFEIEKAKFDGLCNLKKARFCEREFRKAKKAGDEAGAEKFKDEAFEWYEKALNDASADTCEITEDERADLAYRVAYHKYTEGDYSEARTLCNKAASLKPGWGEPYMLIGNMYASSGKRCSDGVGTGWDAQVVAWAAMDMWAKARNTDPSVAGDANAQIAKYKKYLPTVSDIFARGYKEGQSYTVGCWIGVTTTIRAGGE
jgi:tetratricopeptide (TPR) repeat protein